MAASGQGLRLAGTHGRSVTFSFDDVPVMGFAGEMLAAALLGAGIRALGRNPVDGAPRGLFCAMGACQECVVLVDGTAVEACRTPVRDGMVARRTG
jgi:hypothetical protein